MGPDKLYTEMDTPRHRQQEPLPHSYQRQGGAFAFAWQPDGGYGLRHGLTDGGPQYQGGPQEHQEAG
jgi:hypothetical protein